MYLHRGSDTLCGTEDADTGRPDRYGNISLRGCSFAWTSDFENAPEGEMDAFLQVYRKMGGQYEWNSGKLIANGVGIHFSLPFLETEVYPGFPTDLQSPLLAVLATVPGKSLIKENIFENRFKVCNELCKMGADIEVGRKHSNCLWRKTTWKLCLCRGTQRWRGTSDGGACSRGKFSDTRMFFYPTRI